MHLLVLKKFFAQKTSGYRFGALTWEWAPTVAIRSPLYPLFFAGIYKALAFSGVDSRDAVVLLPRLFHGLLAGVTDYTIYSMAIRLSGKSSARVRVISRAEDYAYL